VDCAIDCTTFVGSEVFRHAGISAETQRHLLDNHHDWVRDFVCEIMCVWRNWWREYRKALSTGATPEPVFRVLCWSGP